MNNLSYLRISDYFKATFPALTHSSFRWFWVAQIFSLIGTWTQNIGQAWLVLQLTRSPFLLGIISALQFTPMMLFSLHAGVWIDRLSKRRILIVSQSILMIQAFTLAALVSSEVIQFWMLAVMACILGIANTMDVPARQAFVVELVGRKDLTNAIALNSAIFNSARLIGPAIAGTIMGIWGITWCFIINGISFIGVIGILVFYTKNTDKDTSTILKKKAVWPEIWEGLQYIGRTPPILLSVLMVAVLSAVAWNFNVLVPVLAKMELHEEALGYGLLMSGLGFGALIGALTVTVKSRYGPQLSLLFSGASGLGIFSIVLGFQKSYIGALIILFLMGWSMIVFAASANSLIQVTVDNRLRGRVMSVYSLVFGGMAPIGSLYAGTLSNIWGASNTFMFSGVVVILFLGILFLNKKKFVL